MTPNDQFRKPSREILEILANNIRAYRKAKRMSQEDFAADCGLHRTYIGAIERCERNVTISTIELIADNMGLQPYELLIDGKI